MSLATDIVLSVAFAGLLVGLYLYITIFFLKFRKAQRELEERVKLIEMNIVRSITEESPERLEALMGTYERLLRSNTVISAKAWSGKSAMLEAKRLHGWLPDTNTEDPG